MMTSIKDIVRKSRFAGRFVECPIKGTLCLAEECFNCKHVDDVSSLYNHVKCVVKEKNIHDQVIRITTTSLPLLNDQKVT